MKTSFNQDIAQLSALIQLSPLPSNGIWESVPINEFSGESALIAVLDYPPDSSRKLRDRLVQKEYPLSHVPRHVVRDWMPTYIRSRFIANEDPAKTFRVMEKGFEITPFAKGAMLHGVCFWVGDQLVLHMYAL